jgi:hypothetical protein
MMGKPTCLLLIVLALTISRSQAQTTRPDTMLYSNAARDVIRTFNAAIGDQSEIYNGAEYKLYPPAYKGSPYFQDENHGTPSLILYNGTWYKNVPVLYDVLNDEMIGFLNDNMFVFRTDKLSQVYLSDHHFIYLDAGKGNSLQPGFYDELYNGKTQVLVKRIRTVQSSVSQQTVEVVYETKDIIYIRKGNSYQAVSSKGSVMDVMKDKKKQLNQYLGDNKIRYNSDREASIAKLAGYYDQISN